MKLSVVHLKILLFMALWSSTLNAALITTYNINDPQPVFAAHYPYSFLVYEHKNYIKGINKTPCYQPVNFSVMPFIQFAKFGTDVFGNKNVHIGNIPGRMNVLAVLPFNVVPAAAPACPASYTSTNTDLPCGQEFPAQYNDIRFTLLNDICTIVGSANEPTVLKSIQGLLEVQQANTGYALEIGVFDNAMKYRKNGVRFNLEAMLGAGFGFMFCGGFASISQTPALMDSTRFAATTPLYTSTGKISGDEWASILGAISTDVMANVQTLANAVNLDINAFDKTSVEDLHLDLFWRGVIPVQQNPQIIPGLGYERWSKYLAMPFFSIGGSFATGKKQDPNILFSLPFGNNGHNAIRARGGVCLDFYNTIELSGELGVTHFFLKTVDNLRIPNNNYQMIFYPFGTTTQVKPGQNWHLALGMYAYNFESIVSASIDYVMVHHGEDKFILQNQPTTGVAGCSTTAFNTELLASRSSWIVHRLNGSLTFALSPHARLLLFVQIPLAQRNAYRSTTWGVSIEAGF